MYTGPGYTFEEYAWLRWQETGDASWHELYEKGKAKRERRERWREAKRRQRARRRDADAPITRDRHA